jgi:superoxide dismutase
VAETAEHQLVETATGAKPLLAIDCREHAYYIDHQSYRLKWATELFRIVNWQNVE